MSNNMNVFANSLINTDEYTEIFNDNYDVTLLNKSNKQKFKNDYSNEIQSKINSRIIQLRKRDARYSLKNRRTINNDWKSFNNNQ
jgi:hypothetical protein